MILGVRRRLPIAAAAAASVLSAAGCGGGGGYSSSNKSTPAPAPPTTAKAHKAAFTVTEREYSLSPATPELPRTGTFTISVHNAGATQHALEVEGPAGEVRTGAIEPGRTAELTVKLTKPGRYEWYCPIDGHRGKGMRGTIVVAGGGSPGADDSGGKGDKRHHKGDGGSGRGKGHSGGGKDAGRRNDQSGNDSGDSGAIGPSNDSGGGYMP